MKKQEFLAHLNRIGACREAIAWVKTQDGNAYDIWRKIHRGDWSLWLVGRAGVDRKAVVLAACGCARQAWDLMGTQGHAAIETAESWARGGATIGDVRAAAYVDHAAADADDVDDVAAYVAAYAAAYAAYAYAAADADDADDVAAYVAAYAAARVKSLMASAVIVRRHIKWCDVKAALEGER